MVYEARPGQTFLLGATTWRIEEITRDRVIVTPAPGCPGAVPFWKGDGIGRPAELGRGDRRLRPRGGLARSAELAAEYDLDRRAANNLVAYLREQQAATRVVPSDETIVVERFRDEIGDWRLCVLSPYGGRVHAAWGLALAAKIRASATRGRRDLVRRRHRHPPARRRRAAARRPGPDRARRARGPVVGELSGSALFGARFRENASRSLLIPRAYPGKRTPLWQQRLKSQSLLEVAPRLPPLPGHPRDLPRVPARRPRPAVAAADPHRPALAQAQPGRGRDADRLALRLLAALRLRRHLHVRGGHAERRAARRRRSALDRDLLRELLGQEELRELIDPEALDEVEAQLQHRTEAGRAQDRDALQQVLRNVGDLSAEECGSGSPRATRPPRCWRS
jgi:ATP-dependent Lhr-like helicase